MARHTRKQPRRDLRQRGTVLIGAVLITLLLGSLSVAFLSESLAEKSSVELRQSSLVALQIAEKGLIEASQEVLAQHDGGDDGIGVVSGNYAGGAYAVTAQRSPDNPDRWTLTATGTYHLSTRRLEVGVRRRAGGPFVEGLFSKDTLTFNGKTGTDAYDSRLGSYASQAVNHDSGGTYADGGGHIGSNEGIVLHGSSVLIRGNAIPGPLHSTSMSGNPDIWGDILPRRATIELPAVARSEFEAAFAANDNAELLAGGASSGGTSGSSSGNGNGNGKGKGKGKGGGGSSGSTGGGNAAYDPTTYSISSSGQGEIELAGGTYFFTDVRLTGQSVLRVNGPSEIYITGDLDLSGGGVINGTGRPLDLRVFVHPYAIVPGHTPSSSTIKVRGGSSAALALYAPGADLTVAGGGDIFGSFIAATVTIAGNTRFHYDKSMGETYVTGEATLERLYWRDLDQRLR